ncbi:phospholipase A2 homolog otoconin-22-like [Sceloporus undulatus]|uniref:phospholipase A2 homolog otoconin-22-like n=1 Tax=Sceloporus undulatus TaxID=8520 RepID=UPI001C4D21A6|nr:phospholipase A2 homolog otoconin-22-like [Sceloporus undulatus]
MAYKSRDVDSSKMVLNRPFQNETRTVIDRFHSRAQMKNIIVFLLLLAYGSTLVTAIASQFNEMIQLNTVTFSLANFTNYGCHCGSGTQGFPVDDVDRCCHSHDCCYNKAEMFGCTPHIHTYRFYAQRDKIKCVKSRDRCEKLICDCDRKAASCFRKHIFTYNPQFKNHPVANCQAQRPFC